MTYDEIVALALTNTHTKSGQVLAANLKKFFNIARKTIGNRIIKDVDENYFFQIWKRDAIADQTNGEYPYPEADNDSAGMLKLLGVAIKGYDSDVYYKLSREVDIKTLQYDWAWYLANQSKSDPIHFIADESIFIAPQFAAADLPDSPSGNMQIKLNGIAKLIDLHTGATDAAILIPDDSHWRIALGMEQFIYKSRKMKKEAFDAKQEFEIEMQSMVDEMTNRDNSGMQATLPSDYNLGFGE